MITPCKNCIFAKYEGKTQTDCDLGRIEVYRSLDIPVIEAYDHDKEFYLIRRLCPYYRDSNWNLGKSYVSKKKMVLLDARVKCDILIKFEPSSNLKQLKKTIKTAINQEVPPSQIIVINERPDISETIIDFFSEKLEPSGIPWKVINSLLPLKFELNYINNLVQRNKILGQYYLFNKNKGLRPDVLANLNNLVNDLSKQFMIIDSPSNNNIIVPVYSHIYFGGHSEDIKFSKKVPDREFVIGQSAIKTELKNNEK